MSNSRIGQTTHSIPTYWRPDSDSSNLSSLGTNPGKQILTGGREVTALKLSSGTQAAHIDLYDWKDNGTHNPPVSAFKWALDCSNTNNDTQTFASPLYFGAMFAVLTEGSGNGAELYVSFIPTTPTA